MEFSKIFKQPIGLREKEHRNNKQKPKSKNKKTDLNLKNYFE